MASRWHILYRATCEKIQARREALIQRMGSRCERCGSTSKLEFNHTHPRTWEASAVNRLRRIELYEQDYANGHLNLLCQRCNKIVGEPKPDPDPDFVPDF